MSGPVQAMTPEREAEAHLEQAISKMARIRDGLARTNPAAREFSVAITETETGLLWLLRAMQTAGAS